MKAFRSLLFLSIFLLNFSIIFSGFYADIIIDVKDNGQVSIDGKSNIEDFQNIVDSDEYTSKKGQYWILNITVPEKFDNYIFELNLPKGAQINYIKTTPNIRIDESDSRLKIIGTGENKPFNLLVQYKVDKIDSNLFENYSFIFFSIIFFISLLIIIYLTLELNKKKIIKMNTNENSNLDNIENENKIKIDIENLPERQQEIIKLLEKNKKMTQKQLELEMKIPKSSISRNVQSLIIKGVLKKDKAGQSNYIEIK